MNRSRATGESKGLNCTTKLASGAISVIACIQYRRWLVSISASVEPESTVSSARDQGEEPEVLKKILALEWLSSDHSMTGSDMDRPSRVSFTPKCGFKGQDIGGVAHDFCAPRGRDNEVLVDGSHCRARCQRCHR